MPPEKNQRLNTSAEMKNIIKTMHATLMIAKISVSFSKNFAALAILSFLPSHIMLGSHVARPGMNTISSIATKIAAAKGSAPLKIVESGTPLQMPAIT